MRSLETLCVLSCVLLCVTAYYLPVPMDDDYIVRGYRTSSYGFQPVVNSYGLTGGYRTVLPPAYNSYGYVRYGNFYPQVGNYGLNYGMNTLGGRGYYHEDIFKKKKK